MLRTEARMAIATKLSWSTVDLDNRAELDALEAQECAEGVLQAKAAIAELQSLGSLTNTPNESARIFRRICATIPSAICLPFSPNAAIAPCQNR